MRKHVCIHMRAHRKHTRTHFVSLCCTKKSEMFWFENEYGKFMEHAATAGPWHSLCIMYKSEMLTVCVCVYVRVGGWVGVGVPLLSFFVANSL